MNKTAPLCASLVMLAMGSWASSAHADSNEATCQVRKDGETKQGQSGPCTFSQRQGYIDLDMRNGETYSLAPGNQANHFKDQKGNKVIRTQAGGNTQEFKWEGGKKIVVTFGASSSSSSGGGGASGAIAVADMRATAPVRRRQSSKSARATSPRRMPSRPKGCTRSGASTAPAPRCSSARSTPNGSS